MVGPARAERRTTSTLVVCELLVASGRIDVWRGHPSIPLAGEWREQLTCGTGGTVLDSEHARALHLGA